MPDPARASVPLLVDESWATLWDRIALRIPDRVAVVTSTERVTYAELEERSARLATTLQRHGVGPGDRVGLFLYNRLEYLVTIHAAFKLGAVPVNMNFRYTADELAALIRISGSRVLVHPAGLAAIVDGATRLEPVRLAIEVPDAPASGIGSLSWGEALAAPPLRAPQPIGGGDRIFMFTGGTTGLPKAAVWLHGQLFDAQLVSIYGAAGIAPPASVDEVVAIAADDGVPAPVTLPITPLMHAMAMFNTMNTLVLGGTVVFLDAARFDPAAVLAAIERERVTRLIVAGNAVALPLAEALESQAERRDLSSLELVMSSGMTWSDPVKARLLAHLDAQLFDIVGSSEGGPYAYSSVWSPADLPSALRLATGAVVLDEDGEELDPESGGVGLLAYKGPMPEGYFDDPERTALVYRTHGAYRYVVPGDWVRLLGERRIEFLGRGSSVVNTGGEKVYPAEVEEALLRLPEVADCVVFGVPDERWGEIVAAVVQPVGDARLDAPALAALLGDALAPYKRPRRVVVLPSLERSPSGKADMTRLRAIAARAGTEEGRQT